MATKHYRVNLENFEGPLDLLLFLIKKNDLDILNIEISKITKEYIAYLEIMQELNPEVVGEFLVMASTLMQIKAKSLLPSADMPEEEIGPDPRSELVAKLVEYQKFKEAANFLKGRSEEFQNVFYRGAPQFAERDKALNIQIFDLLGTLREVLDRAEEDGRIVEGEQYPIEDKIDKILKMLQVKPYIRMIDVFEGEKRRRAIVTCFMALLELIKTQRVFARQDSPYMPIMIYKKEPVVEKLDPVWASDQAVETEEPKDEPMALNPANGTPPWKRPRKTESLGEIDEAAAAAARAYLEEKEAKDVLKAKQPKQEDEFELPPDRAPVERASERIAAEAEAKAEAEAVEKAEVEESFFEPQPQSEASTVEVTAEETIDEATEETSEVTAEETPEVAAEERLEVAAEETPEVAAEETPEVAAEETPEVVAEVTPEVAAEETPEVAAEETPEVAAEETPEVAAEETPEVAAEETPEVVAEETPEVAAEETPEVAAEETPEVAAEETPEETPDESPEGETQEPAPVDNTRKAWSTEESGATLETLEEEEPNMNFQDEPGAGPGELLDEEKHDG